MGWQVQVTLGKTTFLEGGGTPELIESTIGARRYGYFESYYQGNPGYYQYWNCGINDSGFVRSLPSIGFHWPFNKIIREDQELAKALETPELREFRAKAYINTWHVCGLAFSPRSASIPTLFWPDADELRTFVQAPNLALGERLRRTALRVIKLPTTLPRP